LTEERYRPTKDRDLLAFGDDDGQRLESMFQEICNTEAEPDGLEFDSKSIRITEIRENQEYRGKRIALEARLGKAIIPILIDVAFGNIVKPEIRVSEIPTMLELPAPLVRIYPLEAIVEEKFQVMTSLGMGNSRMKDFFGLYEIADRFHFEEKTLIESLFATFERRKTPYPSEPPIALTEEFAMDSVKQTQWKAFLGKGGLNAPASLAEVVIRIGNYYFLSCNRN